MLIAWAIPASLRNGLAGADLKALGIPSVEEMAARYAQARQIVRAGGDHALSEFPTLLPQVVDFLNLA